MTAPRPRWHALRIALAAGLAALTVACVTVPPVQQAFALGRDGAVVGAPRPCTGAAVDAGTAETLPNPTLRVLSWNLHKNGDPGWDVDLTRFAAAADLLLIQEAALTPRLREVLAAAGVDWLLASSFALNGNETGVLSAARVRPAAGCVQRHVEPLLQLPKSAVITRYRLPDTPDMLAVANVHSINFTLGLDDYRAQLEAIARELEGHRGPVIVAGDFNTWSEARVRVANEVMARMGLESVPPHIDKRTRILGQQVDHIFVRGLAVVHAEAPEVTSSDHNPVLATLRVCGTAPGCGARRPGTGLQHPVDRENR